MADDLTVTLADLDARLRAVETLQDLILRILSTTKPLDNLLDQFGATETQERAVYALLDDLASRTNGRENDQPTYGYFEMKMSEIFPARRRDPEFLRLLVDTLRVERAAYRDLYTYMAAHNWPTDS